MVRVLPPNSLIWLVAALNLILKVEAIPAVGAFVIRSLGLLGSRPIKQLLDGACDRAPRNSPISCWVRIVMPTSDAHVGKWGVAGTGPGLEPGCHDLGAIALTGGHPRSPGADRGAP
jgi:hypothetical protein